MSSILSNPKRIGAFTSSEIHKLMAAGKGIHGFSAPALAYIKKKNLEIKLKRSISTDAYSRSMAWGNFMEKRVFDLLGTEYKKTTNTTVSHPTIKGWAGSCDLIITGEKIAEIKCYQPENFAQYVDALLTKDIEIIKDSHPAEYWQAVSNAVINNVPVAELICYMPYEDEMEAIRDMVDNLDATDQWKYRFIVESENSDLAVLPNDSYYTSFNRFEFIVPQEDIEALTKRVRLAISMLTPIEELTTVIIKN